MINGLPVTDRFVVFTDLDGTLLDHHTYSYAPAKPALERLRRNDVPLILSSSKTMAEILDLRDRLGNVHPLIAENGSVWGLPEKYFTQSSRGIGSSQKSVRIWPRLMGPSYDRVVDLLHSLRSEYGYQFEGFADWDTERVMQETGLSRAESALARQRCGSEPIDWQDSDERREEFCKHLETAHLRTIRGGRFTHILGSQADKASAMQHLLQHYAQTNAADDDSQWRTIAAGDSPNDLAMLESANIAVVIPAASGKILDAQKRDSTLFAREPGPVGWNAAINEILDRFELP